MLNWMKMLLGWLIEPHLRITDDEDRLTARLFSILMLIHILLVAALLPVINLFWQQRMGSSIWDDQDAWVVMAGIAIVALAFGLVRQGFFRAGVLLYILNTATVALLAPFMPDQDAEIGLLTTAIIPVLLTAVAFSYRWILGILLTSATAATILLIVSEKPPRQKGTGFAILATVIVTGGLIIAFRHHQGILERHRLKQIRQGEEAIRKREEQYRNLFETVTDAILIAALDGKLLEVNSAACRQLGYTREELLGISIDQVSGRLPKDVAGTKKAILEKGHVFFETLHIRKDGSTLPVELAVSVGEFAGQQAFLGVARDLTERRRIEEDKRHLEDQLQHAVKMESIGMLAGGVAHDFNNLLTAILGNAELALHEISTGSPASSMLQEILKASQSAASLTRQLLAFSRKQIIAPRVVELNELIADMNNMLRRLIGEDVMLKIVLGNDLGPIMADPGLVEQIVVNLAVNARDAMPDGGSLIIETAKAVQDTDILKNYPIIVPGDFVLLAITDTGTGMTPEVRARIFEPFFTTKPKGRGTGLGLSTTYGAVKQSNGHIHVYSQPGQGTTFRIYFPHTLRPVEELRPLEEPDLHGFETILLVEDDDDVRNLTNNILRRLGYHVLHAASGGEALLLAEQHQEPIQLLLTDVVMPGMNGRQLAEQLVAKHPETKVLYTSGYTEDTIVHRGVLDDSLAFIAKPYTAKILGAKIRGLLDQPTA